MLQKPLGTKLAADFVQFAHELRIEIVDNLPAVSGVT